MVFFVSVFVYTLKMDEVTLRMNDLKMDEPPQFIKLKMNEAAKAIVDEYNRLRSELKIGWAMSRNVESLAFCFMNANDTRCLRLSKVGEGAYGECFRVETTENPPPEFAQGGFLVKKLKGGEPDDIYKEAARLLLITSLGHYGIVESYTFENMNGQNTSLVLVQYDSSQNVTVYVTMKDIEGKTLDEALDQKELTDYDKLRIVVRVADTLNFLHSYKLVHCDLTFVNVMLREGTLDPVLIDLGSMRNNLGADYTTLDTSDYHGMIYKMYRNCSAADIPPVVKPIFDKWEDRDHWQMSVDKLATKYFGDLSAYHTICSFGTTDAGFFNIVPCRQDMGGLFYFDLEAMREARTFTEYFERTVMKLEEQDTRIRKYSDLSRETKNKHLALKPPFKCENVDGLHCFTKTRLYQRLCEAVRQEILKQSQRAEEDQPEP